MKLVPKWTQTQNRQANSQDTQVENDPYRNLRYIKCHFHQQLHHQVVKVLEVKGGLGPSGAGDNQHGILGTYIHTQ